jgi:hypothetical protein
MKAFGLAVLLVVGSLIPLSAQSPPPLHPASAPKASQQLFYRGANKIAVAVLDGVGDVYRFTKHLFVHGKKTGGTKEPKG